MQRLGAFIEHLRGELGVAYPIAHARPWVGPGRHLFISAQEEAGLAPELWACVEPQSGVMLLLPPAESFLERVDFDGIGSSAARPDSGRAPDTRRPPQTHRISVLLVCYCQ